MMSPCAPRSRCDGSCPEPAMGTGKSNSSTERVARCACVGAPGLIFLTVHGANRDASSVKLMAALAYTGALTDCELCGRGVQPLPINICVAISNEHIWQAFLCDVLNRKPLMCRKPSPSSKEMISLLPTLPDCQSGVTCTDPCIWCFKMDMSALLQK